MKRCYIRCFLLLAAAIPVVFCSLILAEPGEKKAKGDDYGRANPSQ